MDSREMALALTDMASAKIHHTKNYESAMQDALKANKLLREQTLHNDAQAYVQAELARIFAKQGNYTMANK